MKTFNRDNQRSGGYGGERKFAGKTPWKRPGAGGFDRPELHDATCAECGNHCQVPFRPNGSKPVLCRDCFKKGDNYEPKRFEDKRPFHKPSFGGDRPSFGSDRPRIDERLKALETKIDAVLKALERLP